ncbi:YdjC-like family protein [Caballeronia fortuita]|uniref:YdjC-like family protein n=1 Tax=Caballeronia fortuita TaxID=1777138 RepID=A0A158BES3_9BURK|nr:hopanoid biosynthesis-associated protein HpnK [Caballeronia fortuita]SAK68533.1 YdjC-like family protein [Caballeronia fortuita]
MRAIIVTADDFGLHERVNEAVARAHCDGALTCASLMVGAHAAHDAVRIARELPALRVGLHLVLNDGAATLPRWSIPDLVDARGCFEGSMFENGVRFFFRRDVRRQLGIEIHAQFKAFAATGLALDHVNVHKHFQLHPTVLGLILEIGPRYGMRAMRLPREPNGSLLLAPWIALVKKRLDDAGIAHNDWVAGIAATGRMDEAAWLAWLANAPEGVLEIYSHPAMEGTPLTPSMRDYRHADEFAALCSPRVRRAIEATGAMRGGFADVFGHARTREPVT